MNRRGWVLFTLLAGIGCGATDIEGQPSGLTVTISPAPAATMLPVAARVAVNPNLPLGQVTSVQPSGLCPSSGLATDACLALNIEQCAGADPLELRIKVTEPPRSVRGTIVFGTDGHGVAFYEDAYPSAVQGLIQPLLAAGYRVVQRAWAGAGWFPGTGGGGPARQACRYATAMSYLRTVLYPDAPLGLTGNSAGSAEIAYSLSRYGIGQHASCAVLSSGPGLTRVDYGCLGTSVPAWQSLCDQLRTCGPSSCAYGPATGWIDDGYPPGTNACATADATWTHKWRTDSIAPPGVALSFPNTAIHVVLGEDDCGYAGSSVPQGRLFVTRVTSAISETILPGVDHWVPDHPSGIQELLQRLSSCMP